MKGYDVIVVGLGAMGSATLCHLARRGHRVLGLEQFAPGHQLGSSHGDSRIIREQYFENPLYVPLVRRAYELWRELEEQSGRSLMTITGGLMIGPREGTVVSGTLRSATAWNLRHELLDAHEVHARFPTFSLREDLVAVLDPRAGFVDPEGCNSAHIDWARQASAEVRFNEPVVDWAVEEGTVRVNTSSGAYLADRLLISAGAWNRELLKDLILPLTVERQVAFWFEPDERAVSFEMPRFPIYAYEHAPDSICYGFPRLAKGVKASIMHSGEITLTPDLVRRAVLDEDLPPVRDALRPILPELSAARVTDSGICLFTNTPDHDFIIDFHPQHPEVLISSPCSGHGFKFASVIGEIQADLLTTGSTPFDISAFEIGRFRLRS
jgi:sarcosine oxidase